jgi:hypothetical protein
MSVAKVVEITSESSKSFEDAVERGIERAEKNAQERAWRLDCRAEGCCRRRQHHPLSREHARQLRSRLGRICLNSAVGESPGGIEAPGA